MAAQRYCIYETAGTGALAAGEDKGVSLAKSLCRRSSQMNADQFRSGECKARDLFWMNERRRRRTKEPARGSTGCFMQDESAGCYRRSTAGISAEGATRG